MGLVGSGRKKEEKEKIKSSKNRGHKGGTCWRKLCQCRLGRKKRGTTGEFHKVRDIARGLAGNCWAGGEEWDTKDK